MRSARNGHAIMPILAAAWCLAAPAALGQQDKAPTPPNQRTTGTGDKPAARPDARKERQPPDRPVNETGRSVRTKGVVVPADEATETRKILQEEAKHRKRLAQIKRLRELAHEKQNTQLLAKLDELEQKMTRLYERKVARWRERLGDEKYNKVQGRLERGRGKKAAGRGAGPARGEAKGRDRAPDDVRGPGRPDARPEAGRGQGDRRGQDARRGAGRGASKGTGAGRGKGAKPDTGSEKPGKGGLKKQSGDPK